MQCTGLLMQIIRTFYHEVKEAEFLDVDILSTLIPLAEQSVGNERGET